MQIAFSTSVNRVNTNTGRLCRSYYLSSNCKQIHLSGDHHNCVDFAPKK